MKSATKEVKYGLKVTCDQPESVEEFDKLAKRDGACLDEAVDNIWFRGVLGDAWYGLAVTLNQETGSTFDMQDSGNKKKDGTPQMERVLTDPKHVGKLMKDHNLSTADVQVVLDRVMKDGYDVTSADGKTTKHYEVKFDPSVSETSERIAKPGKGDLEMADKFIAQGDDKLAITMGKITQVTGETTNLDGLDAEAKRNAVALAVRSYRFAIAKTQVAGLAA